MKQDIFIIIGVVVFLLIIGFIFYIVFKNSKKASETKLESSKKQDEKKVDELDLLLEIARNTTKVGELNDAVVRFITTQTLGDKKAGNLSNEVKKKLSFISAVCANKNADAKTISFLNLEFGKKNPSFKKEIDLYESMGLAKRRMK